MGSSGEYGFFDGLMLQEISEEEYALGVNALLEKYSYHRGIKGTGKTRIKSVGKNLLNFSVFSNNLDATRGVISNLTDNSFTITATSNDAYTRTYGSSTKQYIPVNPNTNYILSAKRNNSNYSRNYVFYYNDSFSAIGFQYTRQTTELDYKFLTPSNCKYMAIRFGVEYSGESITYSKIQLEEGTTATNYEPYTETISYVPVELNGLANGTRDSFDCNSGEFVKKIDQYTLQNNDITQMDYQWSNVNIVRTINPSDSYRSKDSSGIQEQAIFGKYPGVSFSDNTINENTWLKSSHDQKFLLVVAKDKYANLAEAQADLAGTKIYYELAKPKQVTYQTYSKNTGLTSNPNGTLYIEPVIKEVRIYRDRISIKDYDYPVESIESIYKLKSGVKTPVALDAIDISDSGKTFTIDGAQNGDIYVYSYVYSSDLTTIPTIEYTLPLNDKAQLDGNTSLIESIMTRIGYMESEMESLKEQLNASYKIDATPMSVNTEVGEEFTLYLTATNIRDFSQVTFTVIYDPNEVEVIDLCGRTSEAELTTGYIDDKNITVTTFGNGTIKFVLNDSIDAGKSWAGIANSIDFKGKTNGTATITYSVE